MARTVTVYTHPAGYGWPQQNVIKPLAGWDVIAEGVGQVMTIGDIIEAEVHLGGSYDNDSILQGGEFVTLRGTVTEEIGGSLAVVDFGGGRSFIVNNLIGAPGFPVNCTRLV